MGVVGAALTVAVLLPICAAAQDPPQPAKPEAEERPTGLPRRIDWTFNFDATWGTFGFANSLYQNPKEPVPENLSDQWFEGSVKPALTGTFTFANSSQIYGKIAGVGERTYGSAPALVGADVSSFQADDLYIGWRSGMALEGRFGENALDVTVGRAPFTIGRGFLVWDGAAEGGSRGGFWTNSRKAFQFAAIARFHPRSHKVETFYLDKDDLPENDTGTRLWGLNYEFALGDHSSIGASYLKLAAHPGFEPDRDGLHVVNLRAAAAPPAMRGASVEFEYASERNGGVLASNAWTLQGGYEFSRAPWTPKLTYRYALFEGDDPATARSENFDPLLLGFSDWGTWWQGEIAGEYFLANSNLISHQVRAHVEPGERLSGGLILYSFRLDQPSSFAPGVSARDLAFETDAYADWKLNAAFTVSVVLALANPGTAASQAFGRTKTFSYGMVFVAYSY